MKELNYTITDPLGIHARPAGIIVKKACEYECNIEVIKDEKTVKKIKMELPTSVEKIIKCKNPRCITTTEHYVPQVFKLVDKEKALYCCEYCDAIYKAGPQRETVDLFE